MNSHVSRLSLTTLLVALSWSSANASALIFFVLGLLKVPSVKLPLRSESIQLFGYADSIGGTACGSIKTALNMGWDYQLIGVAPESERRAKQKDTAFHVANRLHYYRSALEQLPGNVTALFVDTFDIVFQRPQRSFVKVAGKHSAHVMFSAEAGCYPFTHPHPSIYRCPTMQGLGFLRGREQGTIRSPAVWSLVDGESSSAPIGCQIQRAMAPSDCKTPYLNSGFFFGRAAQLLDLFRRVDLLLRDLPRLCANDQGILSWLYGSLQFPIMLDLHNEIIASTFSDLAPFHRLNTTINRQSGRFEGKQADGTSYVPHMIHTNGDKSLLPGLLATILHSQKHHLYPGRMQHQMQHLHGRLYVNGELTHYGDVCTEQADGTNRGIV